MHRNQAYLAGFMGHAQAKCGGGTSTGLFAHDGGAGGPKGFNGHVLHSVGQQGFVEAFSMLNGQERFYIDPPLLDRSNIELVRVNGSVKTEPEAVAKSAAAKAKVSQAVDFAPPFRMYFAPKPFCSLHCHLLTSK